jgi:hypothetical protein
MKKMDKTRAGDCPSAVEAFIQGRKSMIRTLGGRSEVTFGCDSSWMYCITSGGNQLKISQEMIRLVCERYWELKNSGDFNSRSTPRHLATGEYNSENWQKCPHIRTSPYIAAVVAFVNGEHPFEQE